MTRRGIPALAALALLAGAAALTARQASAAQPSSAQSPAVAPEQDLPTPPIPPPYAPADTLAPVPNTSLDAPQDAARGGPVVSPTLHAAPRSYPGADPVWGTLYRSEQELRRQLIPSPGVRVVVPLNGQDNQ